MPSTRLLKDVTDRVGSRLRHLPGLCAVCGSWDHGRLCAECIARFTAPRPRCRLCALQVPIATPVCGNCLVDPPPVSAALAAVDYGHPWDGLVTRFKFHAALDLGRSLAQQMLAAFDRDKAPRPAWLVPIPLSAARLRERGYNQAWELVRHLARALDCPADAQVLRRIKDTPHQLDFPIDQRAGNVRSAFGVDVRHRHTLRGRTVTLVDDVMTTGATTNEAARTLLDAGAAKVEVWVLARTPRPGEA